MGEHGDYQSEAGSGVNLAYQGWPRQHDIRHTYIYASNQRWRMAYALLITVAALTLSSCASLFFSVEPEDRHRILAENRCAGIYKRLTGFVQNFPPTTKTFTTDHRMYMEGYIGVRGYDIFGDIYYNGCKGANVSKQKKRAAQWYRYGAIGHVKESQYKLGKMLYEGNGIEKDKNSGLEWLASAAAEGSVPARQYLTSLGVEAPNAFHPNTFYTIQKRQKQFRKASNAQWFRESFQNLLGIATMAAVGYYAIDAGYREPQRTVHSTTSSLDLQRFRPVFCSTTGNLTLTGNGSTAFVHGFSTTFCN